MSAGACCHCHRRTIALHGRTAGLRRRLAMTGLQLGYLKSDDTLICEECLSFWLPANVTVHRSTPDA